MNAMRQGLPDGMITEHFSWEEAVITSHRGIANDFQYDSVVLEIADTARALEKVRALLGNPLVINSWYRNPKLNAAVGGAKRSDHMTGCAVDFISPKFGSPLSICQAIVAHKQEIGFKQLILEHSWVHISFQHGIPNSSPRLEVLSLLAGGGYAIGLTNKYGVPYK